MQPIEIQFAVESGAQKLHTGYSEATANGCGSDISKSPKPIKADRIKVIQ